MKKVIFIVFCLLWFCFIFYNSSQSGNKSNVRSFNIVNNIREKVRSIEGKNEKNYGVLPRNQRDEKINLFIRKNAHAFEYCVLAVLVTVLIFHFGMKGRGAIVYILFICLLCAVLDEFHQLYVPGRTSEVKDVIIDFIGANIGMWLTYFCYYVVLKKNNKKSLRR